MNNFQNHHPASHANTPTFKKYSGLIDRQGRRITYLRLAITDRCNLRCRYCRPEQGVPFIPHKEILRFEELERLAAIFCSLGISKVRVTGGEPFSRRGCMAFLKRLRNIDGVQQLHITTNGVITSRYLDDLVDIDIHGINVSLDTLNQLRFSKITRRDYLVQVLQTVHGAIERGLPLKINSVILEDTNDNEIIQLAGLARKFPITVRFIERMPFSGTVRTEKLKNGDLFVRLKKIFPAITEYIADSPTTARIFDIPDYKGNLGIIQGHSRFFCATCNKVRITPSGMLKNCLYDNGTLDLKRLLRSGASDHEIKEAIDASIQTRFKNGYDAEHFSSRTSEPSMAMIGG